MSDRFCTVCSSKLPDSTDQQASQVCPNCGHEAPLPAGVEDAADNEEGVYSLMSAGSGAADNLEAESTQTRPRLMPVLQNGSQTAVLDIEVTGQIVSESDDEPAPVVVRRRRKKSRRSARGTDDLNGFAIKAAETFAGHFKLICLVIAWGAVLLLASWVPLDSPSPQVYYNKHGNGKTTAEWLNFIRHYERESAAGRISPQDERNHSVYTSGIASCIGPDPLAIPDLFEALRGNNRGRIYELAEAILAKFEYSPDLPPLDDLADGIESHHPRVKYWSIRLMALHGHAASAYADKVSEYLVSKDDDLSKAATATLAEIK
jgi:hypothetical protein